MGSKVLFKDLVIKKVGSGPAPDKFVYPVATFIEEKALKELGADTQHQVCDESGKISKLGNLGTSVTFTEKLADFSAEIKKPGVYIIAVSNCADVTLGVQKDATSASGNTKAQYTISGQVIVHYSWGYLSPLDHNMLAFYAALLLASSLIFIIWLGVFLPKWGTLFSVQKDLGFVAFVSVVECAVYYWMLSTWNSDMNSDWMAGVVLMQGLTAFKLAMFAKVAVDFNANEDERTTVYTVKSEVAASFFFFTVFEFRNWVSLRHFEALESMGGALRGSVTLLAGAFVAYWAISTLSIQMADMTQKFKVDLAKATQKLSHTVKGLAVMGILGVALTLLDPTIEAKATSQWNKHFMVSEGLLQIPFTAALIFVFCAWWPDDWLQGYEYSEQVSAEEVQPIGAGQDDLDEVDAEGPSKQEAAE